MIGDSGIINSRSYHSLFESYSNLDLLLTVEYTTWLNVADYEHSRIYMYVYTIIENKTNI